MILSTVITGLTVICLVFGFLLGFSRGLKRSVLRGIILILCIVASLLLREKIVALFETIKIGGESVNDKISGLLTSIPLLEKIGEKMMLVVECLLSMVIYIVVLLILQFLSWTTVYPICKIFVRKRTHGRKKALAGAIVGAITGAVMCIALIAPISGLLYNVSDIATAVEEATNLTEDTKTSIVDNGAYQVVQGGNVISLFSESADEKKDDANKVASGVNGFLEDLGIIEYRESKLGKIYNSVGSWYYDIVSSVKDKNGKTTNFNIQVGALNGAIKLASKVVKIAEMNFEEMFKGDSSSLIESMRELDSIKGDMTDEQKEVLKDMVQSTVGTLLESVDMQDIGIDFETFDITEVNFEAEAQLFDDFSKCKDIDNVDVTKLVRDLSNSKIILSIVDSTDTDFNIDLKDKETEARTAIDNVQDEVTKAKLEKLFFGIPE